MTLLFYIEDNNINKRTDNSLFFTDVEVGIKIHKNLATIAFNNTQQSDSKKCAIIFCRHFTEHRIVQNLPKAPVIGRTKNITYIN